MDERTNHGSGRLGCNPCGYRLGLVEGMKSTLTAQDLQLVLALLGKKGVSMTQDDFGREVGVRGPTVNRWVNDIVPVPMYLEKWLQSTHPRIYRKIKKAAK